MSAIAWLIWAVIVTFGFGDMERIATRIVARSKLTQDWPFTRRDSAIILLMVLQMIGLMAIFYLLSIL